ncbi:alpha/beta fold hydrolase [Arthrobacter sp. ATA002]|uniref:alpha/beta hydrolase n=1 Tax=Arthrobacter sp. ATA002 TaxID=2991715 RepID=UPI0022A6E200|nr:alpha/beta fold hydrolase [Arthrobacter sp. ATA002]WAP52447.1 alpha/beta fold hydrolase [Arthrobacter sp. ATA002]
MHAPSGGDLVVLAPPRISGNLLRRTVERGSAAGIVRDGGGQLSGYLGESPADFGHPGEDVWIKGLPAWVIPPAAPAEADAAKASGVWVIHVHGLGSSRSRCLRGVEAFAGLGFTSLIPSYRTSLDVAPEPEPSHLGASEWRDIEAARHYAMDRGARRILFVGWSLGASIALRTIAQAGDSSTAGAVLVSPALDWPAIISAQLRGMGFPRIIAQGLPHTLNLMRFRGEPVIRWKEMPGTYMQKHLTLPTMILHGSDDQSVPVELSRSFAASQKQPVEFVEFAGAHHTLEWNSAPQLWNQSVQAWCRSLGLNTGEDSIDHLSEAK